MSGFWDPSPDATSRTISAMTVELSLENIAEASQFIDPLFLRSLQFVSAELIPERGPAAECSAADSHASQQGIATQFSSSSPGSLQEEARRRAGCG